MRTSRLALVALTYSRPHTTTLPAASHATSLKLWPPAAFAKRFTQLRLPPAVYLMRTPSQKPLARVVLPTT